MEDLSMLVDFLKENPTPSDDEFHAWAEEQGMDVHDAEAGMYELASKFVELSSGGKSQGGANVDDVDEEQLAMGIKVEMEHTDDAEIAKKIALDHLAEFPNYYTALADMEQKLSGESSSTEGEPEEEETESMVSRAVDQLLN